MHGKCKENNGELKVIKFEADQCLGNKETIEAELAQNLRVPPLKGINYQPLPELGFLLVFINELEAITDKPIHKLNRPGLNDNEA